MPPREDGELDDELDPEVLEADPESEPLLLDEELDELLHVYSSDSGDRRLSHIFHIA